MPKNNSSINNSLFDLLKGKGYSPTMLSTAGKEIPTPDEAEVFQFNFVKDGEDYGKVTLTIDDSSNLIVYYSDDVADSEKETSTESGDLSWYGLLNQLKRFAQRYQLSFELRNTDNLKSDMAKRDYMKKQDQIAESRRRVSEMDNRTLSGDRKEQRANSPEAIAQREKEQQANLKKVSPEMRKKLRLPNPDKEDMAEDIASTRREVNLKKKIDKGVATPEQKREYQELKAKNMGPHFLKSMGRPVPKQDVAEGSEKTASQMSFDNSSEDWKTGYKDYPNYKLHSSLEKTARGKKYRQGWEEAFRASKRIEALKKQDMAEGQSGVSVKKWAEQVRQEHGADTKFWNDKVHDRVIARKDKEIVGSYDRKANNGTVFSPEQGVPEGLNEFAQGDFNGDNDNNDLQLYLNVAKKLNMKKYKPSTAHDLIAKKMSELVDAVDDEKVDWARHMARKAQGLPSMLDQQGVAEGADDSTQVLSDIVANEDFDALYNLMSSDTEAGKIVQRMYNDVSGEEGLHPDDDFEKILSIVLDHLTQDYGQQNMAEANGGHAGSAKVRYTGGMHGEYDPTKKQASPQAHLDAAKYHNDEANKYIAAMNHPKSDQKNKEWYKNKIQHHKNKADFHIQASGQQDVAEGSADKTVRVVKRNGKPIGEIGIDPEASPGNGSYYVKLYDGSVDESGFDTAEEALAELKYLVKQNVAEGYSLKKTSVSKHMEPGDPEEYTQDVNIKDTDYEIINNKTGQVVGTASQTTNDFMGSGALKITMKNGATRWLDIWDSEKGNPQTAFNRFVKDPKTASKYKGQDMKGVTEMDKTQTSSGRDGHVSHSTYGSRDKGDSTGPERTAKPVTAKQATTNAMDILNKQLKKKDMAEGMWDNIKGAAKEFTRDSTQKMVKQAWENTFWPKHIEPALKRISIDGRPLHDIVLGEPRIVENDRSKRALFNQYTVDVIFPIDPADWKSEQLYELNGQLHELENQSWNPNTKADGKGFKLINFMMPDLSYLYSRTKQDLVIPISISSVAINPNLKEQDMAEAKGDEYYDLTAEHVPAKAIPLIKKELAQAGITLKWVKPRKYFEYETIFEIVTNEKGLKVAKNIIWKYNKGNYVGIMNEQNVAEETELKKIIGYKVIDTEGKEVIGKDGKVLFIPIRNYEIDGRYYELQGYEFEPVYIPMKRYQKDMAEGNQQLSVQQLATVSDEALDNAYHYGRSSPGNTFGWQANLKSAEFAKRMIDAGITDIEKISDAIHKGWNVTAKAFVENPEQFDDTEKLKAAGKLEAKLQQRAKLMNIGYSQLPDEEQEKDRVVARALLQALTGQEDVAEGNPQVNEGYYPMGKQGSYSDAVPTTKIIIQHSRRIEEGEQRYRNIAKIFVENSEGERFAVPTNKPGLARVYARHIAEGGTPYDERGRHITSLVEEYSKMSGFMRATRGKQFNESAQQLVTEAVNYYQSLRESLSKMTGHRGYSAYFESWTPALMEDGEEQETNLNELFVQETLDPRIESVMPILGKLQRKLGNIKQVDELAEWADNIIEGDGGQEALNSQGIPEAAGAETLAHNIRTDRSNLKAFDLEETTDVTDDNPKSQGGTRAELLRKYANTKRPKDAEAARRAGASQSELKAAADSTEEIHEGASSQDLQNAILYRVEMRHPDLVSKYGHEYVADKALDVASFYAGAEEIGSSDISAMVNHLVDTLKREAENGLDENLDANQIRAGQLGPTEKVGPQGAVGKLVGAEESVNESEDELARILQMVKHKR
jgi:hypothetical protein